MLLHIHVCLPEMTLFLVFLIFVYMARKVFPTFFCEIESGLI